MYTWIQEFQEKLWRIEKIKLIQQNLKEFEKIQKNSDEFEISSEKFKRISKNSN